MKPNVTKEEWQTLFNRKDLIGWDIKIAGHPLNDNFNNTFHVEQLEGGPDYAYLNSGVMLYSQSAASLSLDQSFPVSLEMQLLASDSVYKRPTGNLCTPGTEVSMHGNVVKSHCIDSKSRPFAPEEWGTAEAVVMGDSLFTT